MKVLITCPTFLILNVTANLQKMSTQKQEKQLNLIKRIKSLADAGLVYSENKYDEERYTELREISLELLSDISSQEIESLRSFIKPEKDYPTPKVDIRAFALNELKQILLVKESYDGKWALPGGWGDIGYTPSEVAIKEIKEETGLTREIIRIHHSHSTFIRLFSYVSLRITKLQRDLILRMLHSLRLITYLNYQRTEY